MSEGPKLTDSEHDALLFISAGGRGTYLQAEVTRLEALGLVSRADDFPRVTGAGLNLLSSRRETDYRTRLERR